MMRRLFVSQIRVKLPMGGYGQRLIYYFICIFMIWIVTDKIWMLPDSNIETFVDLH